MNQDETGLVLADVFYMKERGYLPQNIQEESSLLVSLEPGEHELHGVSFRLEVPSIAFHCKSMSGATVGINTAGRGIKDYKFFQHADGRHLPIMYATEKDRNTLYETREMIVVEGVWDRIAIKRALPEWAVFARLSKGVGGQFETMIKRFAHLVWLCFDQDTAGFKGTEMAKKKLTNVEIYEIRYAYKDPG